MPLPAPLTLAQAKAHLKLAPADTSEDELLGLYLAGAVGGFLTESKRRWPKDAEPTDPGTGAYLDPAVLTEAEQGMARQWLLLTLGHFYENRQSVAVGLSLTELPLAAKWLMNLLREPTM